MPALRLSQALEARAAPVIVRTIRTAPAHCPMALATWVIRWAFAAFCLLRIGTFNSTPQSRLNGAMPTRADHRSLAFSAAAASAVATSR